MHRTRVYVDTSVFGGTQDEEFANASKKFFDRVRVGQYVVLISRITLEELAGAPAMVLENMESLPQTSIERIPMVQEARELAASYLEAEILGHASAEDASHVAIATVAGADLILSWNFKHIVNYERIRKFNSVNLMNGYKSLDIRSPWDLEYGDENEDV